MVGLSRRVRHLVRATGTITNASEDLPGSSVTEIDGVANGQ
jgi:hypothetical protein